MKSKVHNDLDKVIQTALDHSVAIKNSAVDYPKDGGPSYSIHLEQITEEDLEDFCKRKNYYWETSYMCGSGLRDWMISPSIEHNCGPLEGHLTVDVTPGSQVYDDIAFGDNTVEVLEDSEETENSGNDEER